MNVLCVALLRRMACRWVSCVAMALAVSVGIRGTAKAQCPVSFAPAVNYPVDFGPQYVAVGDFNRDGMLDLVTANAALSTVSILLNHGNGTFVPGNPRDYSVGGGPPIDTASGVPVMIAVDDFNRDGNLDVAVANENSTTVSVLLGNGNGTFQAATSYTVGFKAESIAVGDFDHDGKLDFAVSNQGDGTVSILLGNGNGAFHPAIPRDYTIGADLRAAVTRDFNLDGNLDLAIAVAGSNRISILLGNGNGTFTRGDDIPVGSYPYGIAVGDFNKDGKLDLATANMLGLNVSVLLGNGDGTFGPTDQRDYSVGGETLCVAVGDFNFDGNPDLAAANFATDRTKSRVSILLASGDGAFQVPKNFDLGSASSFAVPNSVTTGDFNGDGRLDIAVANGESSNVSVLLNVRPDPPTITRSPISQIVAGMQDAVFTVIAEGSNIQYAWQKLDATSGQWFTITAGGRYCFPPPNAAGPCGSDAADTLIIHQAVPNADSGTYRVRITNSCGQALSSSFQLQILCPADFDGDGFVAGEDFDAFVAAFEAGC